MWYLEKDVVISCAHHLEHYDGACKNVHGHNWKITVYCKGDRLDKAGMLIDFKDIKNIVNKLDHTNINHNQDFLHYKVNPTAENIAKYLYEKVPHCYKVLVEEQEGSRCIYVKCE